MFSRILRRTHMYVALFLGPWILMYALSTFVMNHRTWFHGERPMPPKFEPVREFTYDGTFPEGAGPKEIASQLLASLDIDGAHNTTRPAPDGTFTIQRMDLMNPVRLRVNPATRHVAVERQVFTGTALLERMHRRRGFQQDYWLDDVWGFVVDLFIAAVLFWAGSGLWMWWEMKITRRTGALFGLAGVALFAIFLAVL